MCQPLNRLFSQMTKAGPVTLRQGICFGFEHAVCDSSRNGTPALPSSPQGLLPSVCLFQDTENFAESRA